FVVGGWVLGTDEALIRLDMSEYSTHEDSVMKLIGGHRIWKKSSTEGLLTTRIIQQPRTVLLLDEFEKSNPLVWPLFLQIFDEGRLTDGWGNTASFAETIIIMTSNLGVREGAKPGTGFGSTHTFDSSRQLQEIERVLPPELLGRITETICFDPLDENAIQQLAHDELARLSGRLTGSGWRLEYAREVPSWLASHR
ncbi:MAG: AAA family ATPase, partial [Leucobacter sp.]